MPVTQINCDVIDVAGLQELLHERDSSTLDVPVVAIGSRTALVQEARAG